MLEIGARARGGNAGARACPSDYRKCAAPQQGIWKNETDFFHTLYQWLEAVFPRYGRTVTAMKKADGALRRVNFLSWEDIFSGKKPIRGRTACGPPSGIGIGD
ncbi:MAG: hypothetical protein LT103_14760 [Burkholderiaceae bacterium]|nr:hypothetical protein [Burkholderiaceae bacterium]